MEKISINTLFNSQNDKSSNILGVNTLYENNNKYKLNFKASELIANNENKRKKILETYNKILISCINKIKSENKIENKDIIYDIPVIIFNVKDYIPNKCLEFLDYKLKEMGFHTYIMTYNSIFISWMYLELDLEKNDNSDSSDKDN
jgi:hypothetical protein